MKSFKLKQNSWHYRLATFYGPMSKWTTSTSICAYFWCVILGLFYPVVGSIALGVVLGSILGQTVAAIMLMFDGIFYVQDLALLAVVILALASIIFLIVRAGISYHRYEMKKNDDPNYVEPEPGFITQAYRSFKNKTCHKIDFE